MEWSLPHLGRRREDFGFWKPGHLVHVEPWQRARSISVARTPSVRRSASHASPHSSFSSRGRSGSSDSFTPLSQRSEEDDLLAAPLAIKRDRSDEWVSPTVRARKVRREISLQTWHVPHLCREHPCLNPTRPAPLPSAPRSISGVLPNLAGRGRAIAREEGNLYGEAAVEANPHLDKACMRIPKTACMSLICHAFHGSARWCAI